MTHPFQLPRSWDLVASGYVDVLAPKLEAFSREALQLLALEGPSRVIDVACGPGTASLLFARKGHRVEAVDFAPKMVQVLRSRIADSEPFAGSVHPQQMDGQALGFEDASMDAGVSMFGLMFFPDRAKGFSELFRVLRPAGRAVVGSWLPYSEVPWMQWVMGAVGAILPEGASPPKPEPMLDTAEDCTREMTAAGFEHVQVFKKSSAFGVTSIEEFWQDMVKSSAPIASLREHYGEKRWPEISAKGLVELKRTAPADLGSLQQHAWLTVGAKPS